MLFRGALAGAILLLAAAGSPALADHGRVTTWSGSVIVDGARPVRDFHSGHGFGHAWRDRRPSRTSHWVHSRRHHRVKPHTIVVLPTHRHSRTGLLRSFGGTHFFPPQFKPPVAVVDPRHHFFPQHSQSRVVVIDPRFHCCAKIIVAPGKPLHGFVHGHGFGPTVVVVLPPHKPRRIILHD